MNLAQYFEDTTRRHPDKPAVRCEGQSITFHELNTRCNQLANGLEDLGLAAGDHCVVMLPNSLQVITIYYALAKMGAVIVPVNFLFKKHELEHILSDAKPKAFIGAEPYLAEIQAAMQSGFEPTIKIAVGVEDKSHFLELNGVCSNNGNFELYPVGRSSLKFCISGGSSLPVEFLSRFESLLNTKLYEGYGLTEAPFCVKNPYGSLTKPGSIGLPITEFSAIIVGIDGHEVAPSVKGELLIKGPGVMKGYLNRPEDTRETIKDGWLHTGDIARKDEDGYIYIVDRKKDLVIRGGYNVYPREIEEVIYQIPQILEVAVIGVPHEDPGEEMAAMVVLKEGAELDPDAIRDYVKERLAPYKYPRIIQIVQDSLPKSGTGKILKKEIRKKFGDFQQS